MINNEITEKTLEHQEKSNQKPDESSGMYIRNFLKITDPESGETILETAN